MPLLQFIPCSCDRAFLYRAKIRWYDAIVMPLLCIIRPWRCTHCGHRFYSIRWTKRYVEPEFDRPVW